MPAALPIAIRKEIVERRSRGESFRQIAREMVLSYDSVRAIWRHWEKQGQLGPNYDACRSTGPRKPGAVVECALHMKREHRRWGAGLIRLLLRDEFEACDLPSERSLQRWFRQAGLGRAPNLQQHSPYVKRGQGVHEVWAVDAKEKITLGDGSQVSWLTISDEASGAILHAAGFPPQVLEPDRPAQGPSVSARGDGPVGETAEDAL
jgi:transposase